MKVPVNVEVEVTVGPTGIKVGETLVTWGYLLDQPEVSRKVKELLCCSCDAHAKLVSQVTSLQIHCDGEYYVPPPGSPVLV